MQPVTIIPYLQEANAEDVLMIQRRQLKKDYPAHGHDYDELELIVSGSGQQWVNNEKIGFGMGRLFLLSPNDYHRVEIFEPVELLSIHFLPQTAEKMGFASINQAFSMQLSVEKYEWFMQLLTPLITPRDERRTFYAQELQAVTTLMLVELFHHGDAYPLTRPGRKLQRALKYIQLSYADSQLRLEDTAKHCGLSPCYFSSLFYQNTGCHYADYVADCRLRHARGLLKTTSKPMIDVAFESGFASLSHFFRIFKKVVGCTPSEYRAREKD